MIEQVIIQSTADTTQAEQEYKGLRVEIKELKKELDLLEEGTAEYDATFTKLSNKMKQQQDRTRALRTSSADLGDLLGNTSKVIGGVSQAFAGATAAMSLFGVENEALLRTIQKVQAFESIARTFTGLEETITKTLPALRNNIKAFFKDTNKLKLNVGIDAGVSGGKQGAVQTIDEEAVKRSTIAAQTAAASSGVNAANSNAVAAANAVTTAEKYKQLAADKALLIEQEKQLLITQTKFKDSIKNRYNEVDLIRKEKDEIRKQLDNENLSITERNELIKKSNELTQKSNQAIQSGNKSHQKTVDTLKEAEEKVDKTKERIATATAEQEKFTQAANKSSKALSGVGSVLKGIGIGLLIAAAIALVTKLIEHFKKMNDAIKEAYANAMAYNQEYASAVTKSTEKELSTLKALDAGYKNLGENKQAQNKYLKDNAKFYKEIGIDVNKIIKGEKDYQKEIENTTNLLKERGKAMGVVNLLIEKYSKQAELQTQVLLNAKSISNLSPFDFTYVRESIPDITERVTEAIALGYGNSKSILAKIKADIIAENKKLLKDKIINEEQYKKNISVISNLSSYEIERFNTGVNEILEKVPDEAQTKMKEVGTELNNVTKTISKLEPQVTGLFDTKDGKGAAGATTVVKTYNELLQETLNLYQGLNLNNPFTPEKIREIELQFENVKDIADKTIFEIANNEALSDEEKLNRISNVNQLIIKAERDKIVKLRQINIDNAKWERDNQLRQLKEQAAIQKNNYKQVIIDAEASLKAGAINQEQFNERFNKIQKAAGTSFDSVKEFFDYLGGNEVVNRNDKFINGVTDIANSFKSINDGVETIDVNAFKNKIKELYGVDLDVTDPSKINLGSLSVDEFNFLQKLIELYQGYANTIQGIDIQSKSDLKTNTVKNYAEQLDLINKQFTEIENEYNKYQSRLRTQINDNSNISFMDFITGNKSGYQNREDTISGLEADIEFENQRQESIKNTIKLKQDELLNENITLEERTRINEELKQLDVDLTNSEETESEKRLLIAEKEKEKRKEIFDATVQGLEDVTTIISNIYDANETAQMNNLKRLLNARVITQEQYEQRSEDLANEYAKKRQRIEIFIGLLNATASSIGAFTAAMRPDSGLTPPWNLIVAGASSIAAFSAVAAQVATLRGLSIGDTSVNPVHSTAGSGLNYTLQEQQVTNERLLNSLTNQKVYVLESEITATQCKVSEVQAMSVF